MYEQIYRRMAEEIQQGSIAAGEKLPSIKGMMQSAGVSRSTVEGAYAMLQQEGYIYAKPRSGYYAASVQALVPIQEATELKEEPAQSAQLRYDFRTNAVDLESFPFATWAKLFKEGLYTQRQLLMPGDPQGDLTLRRALAQYLHAFRGVRCSPEQVVIGAGMEYLLMLLNGLFPAGGRFAMENPGYGKTAWVLRNLDRPLAYIPLDSEGMSPVELEASCAVAACLTPSHQFPTGRIMPVGRRAALLRWACERPERYLIEDDYNGEFHYQGRPIPAIQGLDSQGKVIYMGTFSRSLAPSIRIAYLVLPPELLMRFRQGMGRYASTVSRFEQYALYRFIEGGYLGRHLNRMKGLYCRRRDGLTRALRKLPDGARWSIAGARAGLHLMASHPDLEKASLTARAKSVGVGISFLSDYYFQGGPQRDWLVLGYGGMKEAAMEQALTLLFGSER